MMQTLIRNASSNLVKKILLSKIIIKVKDNENKIKKFVSACRGDSHGDA